MKFEPSTRRSSIASDFFIVALSETVLVLDGCLNCGDADRVDRSGSRPPGGLEPPEPKVRQLAGGEIG
ncbi:MAG: hypothetical protein NT168_14225 [Planctomycetota bacterium]|nr:hypothetical protein [Planctomycetota bacterium]